MNRQFPCDPDEIRRAVRLLHEPYTVCEVRALRVEERGYLSERFGYFTDVDQLVVAVKEIAAHAEGIYVTLNPIDGSLLARANNRLKRAEKGRATGDKHVVARRWLLVDLDPVRPPHISSSDEELALAQVAADRIATTLGSRGWPQPVIACSGNGYHLLYRVGLPAADGGVIEGVLRGLAAEFDTERVKVDTSVHNPARITKLYGTMARKGDSIPDRPHRLARIETIPRNLLPVAARQLDLMAESGGRLARTERPGAQRDTSPAAPAAGSHSFDLVGWLERHGIAADGPTPWPKGGPGAELWSLPACPWNPEHTDGSAYVARLGNGALSAGCHHESCRGRGWQELRATVEGAAGSSPSVVLVTAPLPEGLPPDPIPPFPESAFVGVLAEYADLVGPTTESARSFQWAACATAISVMIGRAAALPWGPSTMPPTLYVCCLGPTARARKSTALSDVMEILLRPLVGNGSGPQAVTLVEGSVSGEGIAEAIADQPAAKGAAAETGRRALLLYNELGSVLEKIGREQAGNLMEFLMAMFDARSTWSSKTRSKESPSFDITKGTLAVLAASTLDWLARATNELHIASGFINRLLFVAGANSQVLPVRPAVPSEAADPLRKRVSERILKLRGDFRLEQAAFEVHAARYKGFHAPAGSESLQQATGRQDVYSLRVAMVLAAAEGSLAITRAHMEAAWAVTDHSNAVVLPLVVRAGQTRSAEVEDRIRRAADRVVLAGGQTFSQRDLYQRLKGSRGMDSEQFTKVFRAMVTAGEFREVGSGTYRLG